MGKWLIFVISIFWLAGCTAAGARDVVTPAMRETLTHLTETVQTPTQVVTATPILPTAMLSPSVTMTPLQMNHPVLNAQLIQAAEAGNTSAVQELLAEGANINAQDDRGRTPVMAATHGNQVETVRALIEAGADINIRDNRSDNPFLYAGAEGLLEILKLTIDAGANTRLTNRFGGTALIPAAERGHVEIVKELLTRTDVDVNHINNLGWTALLEAIILGDGGERQQQIVQLLVDHGADITIADKDGITPLEHARARGFTAIEQILLASTSV